MGLPSLSFGACFCRGGALFAHLFSRLGWPFLLSLLYFLSLLHASTPASLSCLLLSRCLGSAAAINPKPPPLRPVLAMAWLLARHLGLLIRTSIAVERKQYRGVMHPIRVCVAEPSTALGQMLRHWWVSLLLCVRCASHFLQTVNCCLGNPFFLHVPLGILSLYVTC